MVAIVLAAMGCNGIAVVPSLEEATAMLGRLASYAQAGDFDGLCAVGDGNCRRALNQVGETSAPDEPPTVLGSRVVDADPAVGSFPGRVLGLCGLDGNGRVYRSEILVFRDAGGSLRVVNPVFWNNTSIAGGRESLGSPAPSPPVDVELAAGCKPRVQSNPRPWRRQGERSPRPLARPPGAPGAAPVAQPRPRRRAPRPPGPG